MNKHVQYSQTVPGFYSPDELSELSKLVDSLKPGAVIVEIGVEFGRSASLYLQAARDIALDITLIDAWLDGPGQAIPRFASLMAEFRDVPFTLMSMRSAIAAAKFQNKEIDLLHIDADHSPRGVWMDCSLWLPKLKHHGVAVFHDYKSPGADGLGDVFPGVTAAVDGFTCNWDDLGTHETQAKRRKP